MNFVLVWYVAAVNFINDISVLSFSTTSSLRWSHDHTLVYQQQPTAHHLKGKVMRSLAGPYLIESIQSKENHSNDVLDDASIAHEKGPCNVQWSLFLLDSISSNVNETGSSMCKSAVAWSTLQSVDTADVKAEPTAQLSATFTLSENDLEVCYSSSVPDQSPDKTMIAVLSRVLVQTCLWSWFEDRQKSQCSDLAAAYPWIGHSTLLRLPNEEPRTVSLSFFTKKEPKLDDDEYTSLVRSLFQTMSVDTSGSELVEMVHGYSSDVSSSSTLWLGVVPRHWVHQCNLLHRGIGVLITKDLPIRIPCPASLKQPELYCHQRTATKRIFPLLYDMFVGGVSLVGEEPSDTARREISEELGLKSASDCENDNNKLSDRLYRCVVCTAYNRCVVDVFGYVVDTSTECIVWQEEEVAWGAFVPYDIVTVAAERSISRLIEANKWPGRYLLSTSSSSMVDQNAHELTVTGVIDSQWKQWDFVPDGLLVWESWLNAQKL